MEIRRKSGALCLLDKPEWPTSLIKGFELLKCTYLLFKNSETNIVFRISFHQYVCCLHLLHVRRNKGEKNNGTCWPGFCFVFPKKNTKREHLSHPPPPTPTPTQKKLQIIMGGCVMWEDGGISLAVGGWSGSLDWMLVTRFITPPLNPKWYSTRENRLKLFKPTLLLMLSQSPHSAMCREH